MCKGDDVCDKDQTHRVFLIRTYKRGQREENLESKDLIDVRGLAFVVQLNRKATGAQTAEKVNTAPDKTVSDHTEHHSMGTDQFRPRSHILKSLTLDLQN